MVDLEAYLDKPIFLPLNDKTYFKNFKLNPFTIEWDNGADFAPEFLFRIGEAVLIFSLKNKIIQVSFRN